jgi:hypothetical protein
MGCRGEARILRGGLPVCHSANKTRVIHTEDNPTMMPDVQSCRRGGVRLPTQRLLEVLRKASDAFFQMRSVSGTAG